MLVNEVKGQSVRVRAVGEMEEGLLALSTKSFEAFWVAI